MVQELPHPLAHLDQALRAVVGYLLEGLAATDRRCGDLSLELVAVGAAFAHGWEPLSGAVTRLSG